MNIKTNSPIFVIGPPRCGTTLTAQILGRHSRIFMPGETHFFNEIYQNRRNFGNPKSPSAIISILYRLSTLYEKYNETQDQQRIGNLFTSAEITEKFLNNCNDYRDVLSLFMEIQMKDSGKIRWGNQAPRDIFHIKEILSFYPNAKIIICIRDIKDFLLSYKEKCRATTEQHVERIKNLYHPVLTSLLWKSSIRSITYIRQRVAPENYIIIRYEDLVRDRKRVVRELCECINERFEPKMLEISSNNSSAKIYQSGIFTSSVGRWRNSLTNEEAFIGQLIGKHQLLDFGYKLENIDVSPVKIMGIFSTFPLGLWRAVKANRGRGPMIPYLIRRVSAVIK